MGKVFPKGLAIPDRPDDTGGMKTSEQHGTDEPVSIHIPGQPERGWKIPGAPDDAAGFVGDYRPIEERRNER